MKKYNKILEAINRGIKLALDDFEDNEIQDQSSILSKKKILNYDTLLDLIQFIPDLMLDIFSKTMENDFFINKKALPKLTDLYNSLIKAWNNIKNTQLYKRYQYTVKSKEDLQMLVFMCTLIDNNADLNWIDISNLNNLDRLFAFNFGSIDPRDYIHNIKIDKWNTSNIKSCDKTFWSCINFNGDLSNWDMSNVTKMDAMFFECEKFNNSGNIEGLNNWNVSKCVSMRSMFMYCYKFNCNISNWNTSDVIVMANMFHEAKSFNQNISNWNVKNVLDFRCMFYNAESFNQDISKWYTVFHNYGQFKDMFTGCPIEKDYKPDNAIINYKNL